MTNTDSVVLNITNPRRACAARVTVVGSVCLLKLFPNNTAGKIGRLRQTTWLAGTYYTRRGGA